MDTVVIVGAGILGTLHAWEAAQRGWAVVHLDSDPEPRRASVRNFGMVWVSGRAAGVELELALEARARWGLIGAEVDGVGFRPVGSLTLARDPAELAVLEAVCHCADAAERHLRLLAPPEVRTLNPGLRGSFLAGLHCAADALVEPTRALPALRAHLAQGAYHFFGGRTAVEIGPGRVADHTGAVWEGDAVVVCPGANPDGGPRLLDGLRPEIGDADRDVDEVTLQRIRLQMLETEPPAVPLTTCVADGDTLRYYPAFDVPARAALPAPPPVVERYRVQLLVAPRPDGSLTVGDSHEPAEQWEFASDEAVSEHLLDRLGQLLGQPPPRVRRRWCGEYVQRVDHGIVVRTEVAPGVVVVNGPGGRGMTLAPAIAAETFSRLGLGVRA